MRKRISSTLAVFVACGAPGPGTTETTTGITSVSDGTSSGTSSGTSGGPGSDGTDSSGGGLASEASGSSGAEQPILDVGSREDIGPVGPVGCKGKIDFLFLIARGPWMNLFQEQLVAAFPQFIATIEEKFEDFDYHIMVVDGDDGWGADYCTDVCSMPDCKVGDECCSWSGPDHLGEPCCDVPDYPCQDLDLRTPCDWMWGAGTVFTAGEYTANRRCPIDDSRRYLVKGQTNLADTFACIAAVGNNGWDSLGQALTAAMQKPMNAGGCNDGFLRDDALLMITIIQSNPDQSSDGYPVQWANAVRAAKHGDDEAVVFLHIGRKDPECLDQDQTCELAKMFPYNYFEYVLAPDYGPAFDAATDLVETACEGFAPPG